MFDIDHNQAIAASESITEDYIRDRIHGYDRIIGRKGCDEICQIVKPLFNVIHDRSIHGEPFWRKFQTMFGFTTSTDRKTPMNAANLCPEPKLLLDAANRLRILYNDNVAQQVRTGPGRRVQQIQETRKSLAKSLGIADFHDLALIRNSSEGNNAINGGYRDWHRTKNVSELDTVVVWAANHPTNLEAWRLRRDWETRANHRERNNDKPISGDLFELIVVDFDPKASDEAIAKAFTDKIDKRTRFVGLTETSNITGVRIPEGAMQLIWNHVHDQHYNKCHIHLDATMSWGARPINLGKPYCHSLVSSAHKWFLGPKETAVFYMAKDKVHAFTPNIYAYDYKIDIGKWQTMPNTAMRFELIGQRDDVNIITLDLTQMMWTALAQRDPYARVPALARRLKGKLSEAKWKLLSPEDQKRSWGIVWVESKAKPGSPTLYQWLYDQKGIGGSGNAEKFRLCPHIYNTESDVDHAVEGMNEWRKDHAANS